jgi:hypothetical protein
LVLFRHSPENLTILRGWSTIAVERSAAGLLLIFLKEPGRQGIIAAMRRIFLRPLDSGGKGAVDSKVPIIMYNVLW